MAKEKEKTRRYFIKTYGCQMNVYDSEKLARVLEERGYLPGDIKSADIILVNTCSVRQNAEDKAIGYAQSLKHLKKQNPDCKIIFCGCIAEDKKGVIKELLPHFDLFIPPNQPGKLEEFLNSLPPRSARFPPLLIREGDKGGELVTIMYGCNNFCSYCIVPYVRGREYSRPMDEVLAEVKGLIENGTKEIMLLGQNVNSYKYGLDNLLVNIEPFVICHSSFVIRFMTSHPRDMSDKLIETIHKLPCVAREFHLPLQSGDDEILKKMNRGYTFDYYLNRVEKIRSLSPRARITTDIMVGFPGETEEQFENTLRAVKKVKFREVFMFAYSSREKTAAAKMPDQISDDIKQKRLQRLIKEVRETVAMKD